MSTFAASSSSRLQGSSRARRTRRRVSSRRRCVDGDRARSGTTTTAVASTEGVLAVLACAATFGQVLEENTSIGGRISAPVTAMGTASALATLGALPTASAAYDVVWGWLMPMGVVLALLERRGAMSREDSAESARVLGGFVVGAVGTVVGTLAAWFVVGRALGTEGWKIAACLCASYIGGSVNFAATAQAVDMMSSGGKALLSAGMAADNFAMACYLGVLFAIKTDGPDNVEGESTDGAPHEEHDEVTKSSIIASLAAALLILRASHAIAAMVGQVSFTLGIACLVAPIFSLATSVIVQSMSSVQKNLCSVLRFYGAQSMSGALMLMFFATLGAMADLRSVFTALAGGSMLTFIGILLTVQLLFTLAVGHKIFKLPLWAVLIAANANVGGPATAAAMASAKGWKRAVSPAIVTGIFGYSIATFIGVAVGRAVA